MTTQQREAIWNARWQRLKVIARKRVNFYGSLAQKHHAAGAECDYKRCLFASDQWYDVLGELNALSQARSIDKLRPS